MFLTLDEMNVPEELQYYVLEADKSESGVRIPLDVLCRYVNPVANPPWTMHSGDTFFSGDIFSLRPEEVSARMFDRVNQCIDQEIHDGRHFSSIPLAVDYEYHCQRIAYLVTHKSDEPIFLDLHDNPELILSDGNHRLYAAIVRGDDFIDIEFTGYAMANDLSFNEVVHEN